MFYKDNIKNYKKLIEKKSEYKKFMNIYFLKLIVLKNQLFN